MTTLFNHIELLVRLAGIAQICLAAGSTAIPGILKWKTELVKVNPLIRHIFWMYAGYILIINFCFGFVSALCADDLTNGSKLAVLDTGFIGLYWISRLCIQFFGFERKNFPTGKWLIVGETVLVSLFVFLCTVYGLAFYYNLQKL
jgi:hypothetical protein